MAKSVYWIIAVLVLLAVISTPPAYLQAPLPSVAEAPLNPYVLKTMEDYQPGPFPYLLNDDYANYNGVTRDISYQGRVLARAHPGGDRASYCVGITFEVFFRAMQDRNRELGISADDFNGMGWDNLFDFMLDWYAAKGPQTVSNVVVAVAKYGVGQEVNDWGEAEPGDFIQFLRKSGSGHTAVFLQWVRSDQQIVGVTYWSSQTSTNGIGVHSEYFAIPKGRGVVWGPIQPESLNITRILPVSAYRQFRIVTSWQRLKRYLRQRLGLPPLLAAEIRDCLSAGKACIIN